MIGSRPRCGLGAAVILIAFCAACGDRPPAAEPRGERRADFELPHEAPPVHRVKDASDPEDTRQVTEPVNRTGEGGGATVPPSPARAPTPRAEPPQSLPEAPPGSKVVRRADGTCWASRATQCPPGETCPPAEPRQVRCPGE